MAPRSTRPGLGVHVDSFKAMHKELNDAAYEDVSLELEHTLAPHVPAEVMSHALSTIKKNYDIYAGLRTEKQELACLRKEIPIPKHHARKLTGTNGFAQDFEIDEQLQMLLTLTHNADARWRPSPSVNLGRRAAGFAGNRSENPM